MSPCIAMYVKKMAWRSEICRNGCVLSLVVSVDAQTLVWTLMARCHCIRSVPNQDLLVWVPVLLSGIKKMAWRSEICRNGWVLSLVVNVDVQTLVWTLMARCHCILSDPNQDLCQKSKNWPDGLKFAEMGEFGVWLSVLMSNPWFEHWWPLSLYYKWPKPTPV